MENEKEKDDLEVKQESNNDLSTNDLDPNKKSNDLDPNKKEDSLDPNDLDGNDLNPNKEKDKKEKQEKANNNGYDPKLQQVNNVGSFLANMMELVKQQLSGGLTPKVTIERETIFQCEVDDNKHVHLKDGDKYNLELDMSNSKAKNKIDLMNEMTEDKLVRGTKEDLDAFKKDYMKSNGNNIMNQFEKLEEKKEKEKKEELENKENKDNKKSNSPYSMNPPSPYDINNQNNNKKKGIK